MNRQRSAAKNTNRWRSQRRETRRRPIKGQALERLKAKIRAGHEATVSAVRESLRNAHVTGGILGEAKEIVGHGNWESWLATECPIPASTARLYMKIAREVDLQRVGDLSLREVAKRLSASDKEVTEGPESGAGELPSRIANDLFNDLKRCLRALNRAQQDPARVASSADVFLKYRDDLVTALTQLVTALALEDAA